ncbi:MAG: anti-sigma factor antagonist [Cyanobacteriota bacterium]|nr:anti-sigma factor antagonist [Cyanobacteriota bacterium]
MEIQIETVQSVAVAQLSGDIDANTASVVQQEVLPLVKPGSKILLDMTGVQYMSSAGLRMLLSLYRRVSASSGKLVLVGLAPETRKTMSLTGFLDFFPTYDTVESGLREMG